ncbi:hypothetical protein [Streptomyces sp. NPDC004728]|uniref:hypothetical protein n=1 Tax=Streptomyces sp. NPDC004728 TaxID=3154289 RepID=UPI0033BD0E64
MCTVIESGEFIPVVETVTEEEIEGPGTEQVQHVRHVIDCRGSFRIGPCAIEDLLCMTHNALTEQRCENGVCDFSEGRWELTDINQQQATGRLAHCDARPGNELPASDNTAAASGL